MNVSGMPAEANGGTSLSRWLPRPPAHAGATGRPGASLSLIAQALNIFRRRKWLIAAFVCAAFVIGLLVTVLATPMYTASAVIEIQRETRNFTMVKGADNSDSSGLDMEFYQTQYGLLESKSLADRVVDQLRLADDQAFFQAFDKRHAKAWFANGRPLANTATRDQRTLVAGDLLLRNVTIKPERLSRLVTIKFTAPDAAFAKKVVDTWAAQFIQQTLARRFDTTAYARRFLEQRLEQLRIRIDQSERQLVDYASRESIVNLPSDTSSTSGSSSERPLVVDDLTALNRALADATADRIQAGARLANSGGGQSAEALANATIGQLRTQRAGLSAEYARMLAQFKSDYPPAVAMRQQIGQIDAAIAREEARISGSLRGAYNASVERESQLHDRVKQLEGQVLDFRRRSIQYNIYQREADTNRQLYDALLQRYKEIGVAGGVGVNNISIVDTAELPGGPSSPRPLLNLAVAILAGLVLGGAAAVVAEQIDDRLRSPAEVQALLDVPLLGTIPKVRDGELEDAIRDMKSAVSEAYLSLQTSLSFSTTHGVPRTLAVTSSRPAEGKSTTSHALARALTRTGKRVLLMDGDMRSPSVHALLGLDNRQGLSNYLSGDDRVDALWRTTETDGLFVMTAGPQPPSAAELLTSERFAGLLELLAGHFDHVVVDAPPVMGLADAPLIGSMVEGTVFVLDIKATRRNAARVAITRLLGSHTHVLGVVLTKYDTKTAAYGYGYDYGYGYGEAA
jgi:polysaccharide biosynthesis transport protein